jgi:glutamate synthase (NADPH/NADH) small chain
VARQREFLDVLRQDVSYRPVSERLRDFRSVDIPLTDGEIHEQASRCMDCGTPFCHGSSSGCPLGNLIPEWNEAVYNGQWKEALDLLLATNVFPEFTGRICPAPCEGACVLGLIRPAVNICKIELAIIEQGFRLGYVNRLLKCDVSPQECDGNAPEQDAGSANSSAICATEDELSRRPVRSGGRDFAFQRPPKAAPRRVRRAERVAVVGSGPAGLATAQVLNQAGYNVTVYEKDERPGGLLRYGIPDFKLEKRVVDQRIDLMAREGVQFQCGVDVGDDIS